jgi:hypothetical protein
VRYGHVLPLLAYLRTDDGDGEYVGEDAGVDVCCGVAPSCAVALDSPFAASFAASTRADVDTLHSSRRRVQLRSGVPVVRIAWLHFFELPSVVEKKHGVVRRK